MDFGPLEFSQCVAESVVACCDLKGRSGGDGEKGDYFHMCSRCVNI